MRYVRYFFPMTLAYVYVRRIMKSGVPHAYRTSTRYFFDNVRTVYAYFIPEGDVRSLLAWRKVYIRRSDADDLLCVVILGIRLVCARLCAWLLSPFTTAHGLLFCVHAAWFDQIVLIQNMSEQIDRSNPNTFT